MRIPLFIKQLLWRYIPPPVLAQLSFEFRTSLHHARSYRRLQVVLPHSGLSVNVGCGDRAVPNWLNLDMVANPLIEFWDCRRGLPLVDGAADRIFAEHFLEHLDYATEAPLFLRECHRCLRPAGVLRVIVPDAGAYLRQYAAGSWPGLAEMRPLIAEPGGYRDTFLPESYVTKMEFINAVFRQNGEHKYAYDAETLINALKEAGFATVRAMSYGESLDPAMTSDSPLRRTESLYVEAVR